MRLVDDQPEDDKAENVPFFIRRDKRAGVFIFFDLKMIGAFRPVQCRGRLIDLKDPRDISRLHRSDHDPLHDLFGDRLVCMKVDRRE